MWRLVKTGIEGSCELFGANIFDYKWNATNEKVIVVEPLHNQQHELNVYEVEIDGITVTFAAGEFSNCVYGFYLRD